MFPRAENLAVGKPAEQSSTSGYGQAKNAVDGNVNQHYTPGRSCTHTDHLPPTWWRVDLEEVYLVTNLTLYNREDCCAARLTDFSVEVGRSNSSGDIVYERCFFHEGTAGLVLNLNCLRPVCGRYVRVITHSSTTLTLCEVQVFGDEYHIEKPESTTSVQTASLTSDQTNVFTTSDQTSSSSSDQTTSLTTSDQTSSVTTSNQTTPLTTSNQTTYVTTSNQTTPLTTSDQTTYVTTSNQTSPLTTSDQTTYVTTSNQTSPLTTSDQITSVTTSNQTTPLTTSDKTISSTTSDQTISSTTSDKTLTSTTSDQTIFSTTSNQTTSSTTSDQISSSTISDQTVSTANKTNTTTTTITTTTTSGPTRTNRKPAPALPCGCRCVLQPPRRAANASGGGEPELTAVQQELVKEIAELRVETKNTSKSVRQKTSAGDRRQSSSVAGYLALALLGTVAALIVLADLFSLLAALGGRLQGFKGRKVKVGVGKL